MESGTIRPKLRNVEVFPVEHEGRRVVCLRDPLALAEEVIFFPLPLLRIVRHFDGKKSLEEIQRRLSEEEQQQIPLHFLVEFTEELDRFHFLDSPRFERHRRQIFSDYAARSTRPPFLAGRSYPADPVQLTRTLEGYFRHEAGPKWPGEPRGNRIAGIIAPHIDFLRGGFCYAWAYREMIESLDPDLFVVLGTIHTGTSAPFTATRKGFETPFGTLEVDHPFLDRLEAAYGHDLYAEEIAHRAEHSIEFQAVFLQSIYNNPHSRFGKKARPITFVPILCSILHEEIEMGLPPRNDIQVEGFFQALRTAITEETRSVLLIASADLSHVGPQFGDPTPLTADDLSTITRNDHALLETLERCDADAFAEFLRRDGNRQRVCGVAPIYTLLRTVDAPRGRLLKYGQWPDPNGTVTFASLVYP